MEIKGKMMLTSFTTYLGKKHGANDAQSGLKVVFKPQPDSMDAASHVDDIKQLQALEADWKEVALF